MVWQYSIVDAAGQVFASFQTPFDAVFSTFSTHLFLCQLHLCVKSIRCFSISHRNPRFCSGQRTIDVVLLWPKDWLWVAVYFFGCQRMLEAGTRVFIGLSWAGTLVGFCSIIKVVSVTSILVCFLMYELCFHLYRLDAATVSANGSFGFSLVEVLFQALQSLYRDAEYGTHPPLRGLNLIAT